MGLVQYYSYFCYAAGKILRVCVFCKDGTWIVPMETCSKGACCEQGTTPQLCLQNAILYNYCCDRLHLELISHEIQFGFRHALNAENDFP